MSYQMLRDLESLRGVDVSLLKKSAIERTD